MDQTPQLRSRYPQTPPSSHASNRRPRISTETPTSKVADIKTLNPSQDTSNGPLVPFDFIDAPTQRLYAVAIYCALGIWKLADFSRLTQDEEESFWLFLKWIAFDAAFLFGLPSFRIPWLEWSSMAMTTLFIFHALFDGLLMFRIPVSLSFSALNVCTPNKDSDTAGFGSLNSIQSYVR